MHTGLRELRQRASELVRRAEAGEVVTVTVSGRPVAELGPLRRTTWVSWSDLAELAGLPADTEWAVDRDAVAHELIDPWTR